ncbi:MAG TPA: cob(I)yrinic acid a,c-diamide adenosyltransferase [Rectinemataceae bacterium]
MSIVTKTGDDGTTGLWSGERVDKDDPRLEAYGTIDELSSYLGAARHLCMEDEVLYAIEEVQRALFRVAGELASAAMPFDKPIVEEDSILLEKMISEMEEKVVLTGFVMPGMTPGSAALDIARTVARRAERRIIALSRQAHVGYPLRRYMNRLSDYLFMLARVEEKAAGKVKFYS